MTWGEINPILIKNWDFWPGIRIGKKARDWKINLILSYIWRNFARIKKDLLENKSKICPNFEIAQNSKWLNFEPKLLFNWSLKAKFDRNIRNSDPDRYHMNQDWYRHVLTKIRYPRDILIIKTHDFISKFYTLEYECNNICFRSAKWKHLELYDRYSTIQNK